MATEPLSREYAPGGRYRLTYGQRAVLFAIADTSGTMSANRIVQAAHIENVGRQDWTGRRRQGMTTDTVRRAAARLVELGLAERIWFSANRAGYRATDQGRREVAICREWT
jgi:Fe2+ or Zn2+ uptake regulation protein